LDTKYEIVLVEPRSAFVHNVAALRAIVDQSLIEKIIIPYGRMLKRGRVVQDRVTEITERGVLLANGGALEGDYTIVATGSINGKPFKPINDDIGEFIASSAAVHAALRDARHVAIVGAGAVGVELAGEIATGMPGKAVTLISNVPIFGDYPSKLRDKLMADFKQVGIELIEGRKAQLSQIDATLPGPVVLDNGAVVPADLIIPALGSRVVSHPLADVPGVRLGRNGRVSVDQWLRPTSRSNLFAFGDMADSGELMTIAALIHQIPFLTKMLAAIDEGKAVENLPIYKSWKVSPIVVPVGPKRGASVLPITKKGMVAGHTLTATAKGKTLLIPGYRKDFGLAD
jgi:NADH dehydrogenase FAD-containing subunit